MKDNYDFSKGERGKFHHANATLNIPIYLEADVLAYFSKKAKAKGVELEQLINTLLKRDIALIEEMSEPSN